MDQFIEIKVDDVTAEDFARMPRVTWTEFVVTSRGEERVRRGPRGWLQRRRARRYQRNVGPLCGSARYQQFLSQHSHYSSRADGPCPICKSMRARGITPPPCPLDNP